MARTFADNILETSLTLGTAVYELQGPVIGYRAFSTSYITGDQPYYVVRNALDTKFEINRGGTFTIGGEGNDTLTRSVLYSSNSNAPVLWQVDDHPLAVYCPRSADTDEAHINGWLSAIRNPLLRWGLWWKTNAPTSGKNQWVVFDGTADIPFGVVDPVAHTFTLDVETAGASVTHVGDTPPAIPKPNQQWFNTTLGQTFIYYNDGNTTQWVPTHPAQTFAVASVQPGADPGCKTTPLTLATSAIGATATNIVTTGSIGLAGQKWKISAYIAINNNPAQWSYCDIFDATGGAAIALGDIYNSVNGASANAFMERIVTLTGPTIYWLRAWSPGTATATGGTAASSRTAITALRIT